MEPKAQEFADAFLIMADRETGQGDLWCLPRDAIIVRQWLTERSEDLGGALRQLTRLVRVMARASAGDYTTFLYASLPSLRSDAFRQALLSKLRDSALKGVADVKMAAVQAAEEAPKLAAAGVWLREPAMAVGTQPFELNFTQMPRLAALLDVLHNLLGFGVVEDLLAGLTGATVSSSANEVARRLAAALNAKLSECFGSSHQLRQAQAIRAFLASTKRLSADRVDDAAVLDLWVHLSRSEQVEGFRLFRSAARLAIRYQQALALNATENAVAGASGLSDGDPESAGVDLDRFASAVINPADWMSPADVPSTLPQVVSYWETPLKTLFSEPASRVKWLTKEKRQFLEEIFEGPARDDERSTALFGPSRFDIRFTRTLLRCCHFSGVQNRIVERMRKGAVYAPPTTEAVAFTLVRERFKELADEASLLLGATAFVLLQAGRREGLALASIFFGDRFAALMKTMMAVAADEVVDEDELVEAALAKLASSMELAVRPMHEAYARVNRVGFRKEDADSAEYIEAMIAGSRAAENLSGELVRIQTALTGLDLELSYQEDVVIFYRHFADLYQTAVSVGN